jgi:hypothetical protein
MRKMILVVLAAACLLAAWSLAPGAPIIEGDRCMEACFEQESACVSACEGHAESTDCDAECHERLEDCQKQC